MKEKLLIAIAVCLLFGLNTSANVYMVTSNLDGGPGTLRQAINDADNNPGADSIKFDMADSSVAGRTIILDSILPSLIGQTFIDATTQIHGNKFGVSFAKIIVTTAINLPVCFNITADSCDIYGFFISGFEVGISINNSFVKIGAINKGNVIFNCLVACIDILNSDHVAFIANLIGVDTSQNAALGIVGEGIRITNCSAIAIGGHSTSTSNVISGNNFGLQFINSTFCNVNGNLIGTSGNGFNAIPNSYGIRGTGVNHNINIGGDSLFQRNIISGNTNAGIFGNFTSSIIQGNYIGTDDSGKNALSNGGNGIYLLSGSNHNLIGGGLPTMSNIIAFNGQEAITLQDSNCNFNSIRGNSTFCNSQGGIDLNGGNGNIVPPPFSLINANGITGVTYPNSTIDIFQDDSCNNCEGKTLIASITSSFSGVYAYNGGLSGNITATVTDALGNTSEYAACTTPDSNGCIIAQFTTSPDTVCANSPISFIDQTITAAGSDIVSWQWDLSDSTTEASQFPSHVYESDGTYTVTLIATNSVGCSDTISKTIVVKSSPVASITTNPVDICIGTPVNFYDQSYAGNGATITGWQWDFGDGDSSVLQNPTHAFNSSSYFSFTVTNSNQCSDNLQGPIQVVASAQAAFTFVTYGLMGVFTNTSVTYGLVSYTWDFGDGSFSTILNPAHTYSSGGVFTVCLTVYDYVCMSSDSICQIVDFPTGVNNAAGNSIFISPNPANDVLIISGLFSSQLNSISILDLAGRKMMEEKISETSSTHTLNLESIPEGLYIVEMKLPDNILTRKISVIH